MSICGRTPLLRRWPSLPPVMLCLAGLLGLPGPLLPGCGDESGDGPTEPRIVPQQSPYNLGVVPILGATAEEEQARQQERSFTIQLANGGGERLEIATARILGDVRCSFSQPGILRGTAFARGRSAVLLLGYRPATPGDDDVMLEVRSNAANFPVLLLPICGVAYDPATTVDMPLPRACREPSLEPNPACPGAPEPLPEEG